MTESGNVSNVFLKFSEKLERFRKAGEKDRKFVKDISKDALLQEMINESEEEKKNKILNTYSSFRLPYSKSIEEDENSLLTCYSLFKSVSELNKSAGNQISYVKAMEFESPLVHKDFYFSGDKFIYLQSWLYFEKNITDFMPVISAEASGKIRLDFVDFELRNFTAEERLVFEVIKENLYNDINKGEKNA